ncbi:S-layer family protein [Caulobacter sp. SSI4214]|uniref:beta strand repeat-containing protein n=1 Tax=Caulobacter sp. SSI4214 TaxID=2575739 RepID=UPI00143CB308|nr:S-layer family protein [Caulobacter sp. SSI4214]
MAYNVSQLTTFFTNANAGTGPTSAQTLTLQAIANQNAAGSLTNDQALSQTVDLASDSTVAVSVGAYQFFTGVAPSEAGLAYLNAAYVGTGAQASLNGENRFIAQSVSLALSSAKTSFASNYGALSIGDATAAAYNVIIGNSAAAAAGINVANAVAYLSSTASVNYYTAFIQANVPGIAAADLSLAVKAAIVGEILFAATSYNNGAGIGSYAAAETNLVKDLADDGHLVANNSAGINLLTAYGQSNGGGQTFALTTGIDTLVGTSGDDTFTGTDTTVTGLDTIDGGAGNNTLKLGDVGGANLNLGLLTVKNIQNLQLTSTTGLLAGSVDVSSWSGLATATFALQNAAAAQTIKAGTSTSVTVSNTANQNLTVNGGGGAVTITNGTGGNVTIGNAGANAFSSATVSGGLGVVINDNSGASGGVGSTLTNVSISGNTGAATVTGKGVATVSYGSTNQNLTITNTTTAHALTLNVSKVTGGVIQDANAGSVTVNTSGSSASTVALSAATATAVTVNASTTTTLVANNLSAIKTLALTGASAVTADVSALGGTLTSVDATGNTKGVNVTIDATNTAFAGGAGNDTVTISAAPTKAIAGGTGADTLVLNVAAGTFSNPSLNSNITGFETLGLGTAATGSYNATGFTGLSIANNVAGNVTFTGVAAGAGLTISAAPGATTTVTLADASGTSDAFTLNTTNAANLNAGTLTVQGVETVTVNAANTDPTGNAHTHTLTLIDAAATKLVVTGSAAVSLTSDAGNTALKVVDASANTGGLSYSSTFTGAGASITGSATAANSLIGAGTSDTIIGGAKADTIQTAAGLSTLTGGAGSDTFVLAANANGNTYATITDFTKTAGSVAGDVINANALFAAGNTAAAYTFVAADKVALANTAAFADYLNAATASTVPGSGAGNNGTSVEKWFVYNGDTYIVVDNSSATTFQNGVDQVVKLSGTIDLTGGTFSVGHVFSI